MKKILSIILLVSNIIHPILTPGGEKISDNLYVEKNTYHSGKVTLGK